MEGRAIGQSHTNRVFFLKEAILASLRYLQMHESPLFDASE